MKVKKEGLIGSDSLVDEVEKYVESWKRRARKSEKKRLKREALQRLKGEDKTQPVMKIKVEDSAA